MSGACYEMTELPTAAFRKSDCYGCVFDDPSAHIADCLYQSKGDRLLTIDEAALRLATTARHIRRLYGDGRLPVVHVGRAVRFRRADLDAFIASNVSGGAK